MVGTVNTNSTLSESELYFGAHALWDLVTWVSFANLAANIFSLIMPVNIVTTILGSAANFALWTLHVLSVGEVNIGKELLQSQFEETLEDAIAETNLNWIGAILDLHGLYSNIDSLAQALVTNTNFYKSYIHFTAENPNYRVYVQKRKINDYIEYIEMKDIDEALTALET